jgi:hypothetical protein
MGSRGSVTASSSDWPGGAISSSASNCGVEGSVGITVIHDYEGTFIVTIHLVRRRSAINVAVRVESKRNHLQAGKPEGDGREEKEDLQASR